MTSSMTGQARTDAPARRRAAASVVAGAFCFSTISIVTVLATAKGTPVSMLILGRYGLAAVVLAALVGRTATRAVGRARALPLLVVGGIGQWTVAALTFYALDYIPAATLVFLMYTFPLWVTVVARLRGTERLTSRRLVALALALSGVAVMVGMPGRGALHPTGVALGLGAAVTYGTFIPVLSRLQRGIEARTATLLMCTGGATLTVIHAAILGQLAMPSMSGWLAMGWLAIVSTVMAWTLWLRGLAVLGPVRSSIVSTAEPFFAAILGALILRQPLTLPTILGGGLVAAAVIVVQLGDDGGAMAADR